MSTTVRDLVDEEEADQEEEEEEGEDEEDEDYVPNEADYDEDEDDEDAYDNDVAEVVTEAGKKRAAPAKATKAANAKRSKEVAAGTTAKAGRGESKPSKRANKSGGITLDDDDDEAPLLPPDEGNASGRGAARTASSTAPSGAGPPDSTEAATPSVDALWAELQGHASAPAAPARTPSATTSVADAGGHGGGGLDIKALLAKTGGATSSKSAAGAVSSAGKQMVEIRTKMDFCGEEILVTKRVQLGSAEELAHRQRTDAQPDAKPATSAPAATSKMSLVASALATSAELRNQMHATPAATYVKVCFF